MVKKISVIRNDNGHWVGSGTAFLETSLISNVLTDTCEDEPGTQEWIHDSYYKVYEGNCSLLFKKDDTMIFQYLYDDDDPPSSFTCSRESFIKLIDQWNSARKENKEFIILELDEKDTINLYASDKVPDSYEPPPPVSSSFFDLVEENLKKRKSMKIEDIELVEIKKIKKSHQTYEQLFKGHQTIMKKSFFPSSWTREHVMEKILEAYEDAVGRRTYLEEGKTKSNIIGLTKEGIVIYITLDMSLEPGNTLITAYPIFTEEYQNGSR